MPYLNGVRVSQDEFIRVNRVAEGRDPDGDRFHTGPNGENPGDSPDLDADTGSPKSKKPKRAGNKRSERSKKSVDAAVANALGVSEDSPVLNDIDTSALDNEGDQPDTESTDEVGPPAEDAS